MKYLIVLAAHEIQLVKYHDVERLQVSAAA